MVHSMICEGGSGVSLVLRKVRMFGGDIVQHTTSHFNGRGACYVQGGLIMKISWGIRMIPHFRRLLTHTSLATPRLMVFFTAHEEDSEGWIRFHL